METIQEILQKLNTLSAEQGPVSPLDRDLMLDLTRRLYERLLLEPVKTPAREENSHNAAAIQDDRVREAEKRIASPVPLPDEAVSRIAEEDFVTEWPLTEGSDADKRGGQDGGLQSVPQPSREPAVITPPVVPVSDLHGRRSEGISVELPEPQSVVIAPVEPDIRAGKEASLPPVSAVSAPVRRVELQSLLSINDRFLLLNELFDNSRKKYETFFEALNKTLTARDALIYARTYIEMQPNVSEDELLPVFEGIIEKRG